MSAKTRITIAVLLLFIPVVLGVAHRVYYHGKDSFVFFWKRKDKPRNYYPQNSEITPKEPVREEVIREVKPSQNINKEIKNAPPRFVGGDEALRRYIKNEVIYPDNQTAQGSVILKMRIDEQGYSTDITVTKSMGNIFDREAVRVAENMPLWEPQIKNYEVVKSDFIFIEVPFHKPTSSNGR